MFSCQQFGVDPDLVQSRILQSRWLNILHSWGHKRGEQCKSPTRHLVHRHRWDQTCHHHTTTLTPTLIFKGRFYQVEPVDSRRSGRLAKQGRKQDHYEACKVSWADEEESAESAEEPSVPLPPPLLTVSPTRPSLVDRSIVPVGPALGPDYGRTPNGSTQQPRGFKTGLPLRLTPGTLNLLEPPTETLPPPSSLHDILTSMKEIGAEQERLGTKWAELIAQMQAVNRRETLRGQALLAGGPTTS